MVMKLNYIGYFYFVIARVLEFSLLPLDIHNEDTDIWWATYLCLYKIEINSEFKS